MDGGESDDVDEGDIVACTAVAILLSRRWWWWWWWWWLGGLVEVARTERGALRALTRASVYEVYLYRGKDYRSEM
jgi:hypothetical protein